MFCFCILYVSGFPGDRDLIVLIICALSHFSQRWKKELEKNREKVLGGGEKKEKEKKEVRVGVVIWDLLYKTQVQSDLIPISVDFILHQK